MATELPHSRLVYDMNQSDPFIVQQPLFPHESEQIGKAERFLEEHQEMGIQVQTFFLEGLTNILGIDGCTYEECQSDSIYIIWDIDEIGQRHVYYIGKANREVKNNSTIPLAILQRLQEHKRDRDLLQRFSENAPSLFLSVTTPEKCRSMISEYLQYYYMSQEELHQLGDYFALHFRRLTRTHNVYPTKDMSLHYNQSIRRFYNWQVKHNMKDTMLVFARTLEVALLRMGGYEYVFQNWSSFCERYRAEAINMTEKILIFYFSPEINKLSKKASEGLSMGVIR